jgi:hypothetical protein
MDYLLLFMATPFFVILFVGAFLLYQYAKDKAVDRYLKLHHLRPDPNGNYQAFYDFQTDTYFRPKPGNSPYPAQYLGYPSTPQERVKNERPLVIRDYSYKATILEPEQLEQPEQKNEPEQLEQPSSVRDYTEYLRQAKRNRVAKTRAITEITGVTRGGGKAWNDWSKIWDEL